MRAHEGLDGVVITDTNISGLNSRGRLVFRGYDLEQLLDKATFADVTFLLWNSRLPTPVEKSEFSSATKQLTVSFREAEAIVASLPKGISAMRSLPVVVAALAEVYRARNEGRRAGASEKEEFHFYWTNVSLVLVLYIRSLNSAVASLESLWTTAVDSDSTSRSILHLYTGQSPSEFDVSVFDNVRMLYAEHGLNASTFTARVVTSAKAENGVALAAAFGAFGGEIHGGAIELLMPMLDEVAKTDNIPTWLENAKKTKRLLMGFGHRIYKGRFDVRYQAMRAQLVALAERDGVDDQLKLIDSLVEHVSQQLGLYPNLDLTAGPTLERLGFARELFVPLTAVSRLSGWCAHIAEQKERKKLIRPSAEYCGPDQIEVM